MIGSQTPAPPPRPSAPAALLLGLLLPGLGYLVVGRVVLAVAAFLLALVPGLAWLGLVLNGHPGLSPWMVVVGHLLWNALTALHAFWLARRSGPVSENYTRVAVGLFCLVFLAPALPVGVRRAFPVRLVQLRGGNMEPMIHLNQRLIIWTRPGSPQVGDVVLMRSPDEPQVEMVKWVAALAGDRVELRHGVVLVNGQPSPLEFAEKADGDFGPVEVPAGSVFVLGVSLNNSLDSRQFGPVPVEWITGRAIGIL